MFERESLERNRCSVRRSNSPRRTLVLWYALKAIPLLLCTLLLTDASFAQSGDTRGLDAYTNAVKQPLLMGRIHAMEEFLHVSGNSRLRTDGLEFLIWDYMRIGNRAQTADYGQELFKADSGNPIAIAVRAAANLEALDSPANRLGQLKGALERLDNLRKPEGMTDSEFRLLKNQTRTTLNGSLGLTSLELRDYQAARNYLIEAVSATPDDGRLVYGLALALLLDKNPDASAGYWYLARAVNLTHGTQAGNQISAFARERYQQDGGNDADWKQFLAAATGTTQSVRSTAVNSTLSASASTRATAKNPARKSSPQIATNEKTKPEKAMSARASLYKNEPSRPVSTRGQPAQKLARQTAPVSLGILVQTGLLTSQNRPEILKTLREIARNLRTDDEAFIMAFSNQLDFEQDLTANTDLLEEALSTLKPGSGAALFDGIAFAAGHLKRIGRNDNRVLLVISDGHDTTRADSTPLSAHLQSVRIDCIGLDVTDSSERDMLQHLAAYSGGKASFATTPGQFHAAAAEIAGSMGIEFQD